MTDTRKEDEVLSRHQPPRPFEGDSQPQQMVIAAYGLRPTPPVPEACPPLERDHDQRASAMAEQLLALQKPSSPVDPVDLRNRLVDAIRKSET